MASAGEATGHEWQPGLSGTFTPRKWGLSPFSRSGFGFGKTVRHNLELMNHLALLHGLGCPVMVGASRKRTIGALSNEAPADRRLPGSIALALKAAEQGAQLIRVHDVPETVQALRVWRGLRDAALAPG